MGPKDWELAARGSQPTPPRYRCHYITPGHTAGTLSVLVPVKDHGVPHLAMEWGGTALSGNTSREMLQAYIANAGRFLNIADGAGKV